MRHLPYPEESKGYKNIVATLLVFVEPMAGIEPATYAFAYTSFIYYTPKRARLYLSPSLYGDPCQSFERFLERYGLGRVWLLTVIRDSLCCCQHGGQTMRVTMALLYQLSYIGILNR